jgi:predicted TIM-barrel fold metal-dependent hydrolase
MNAVSSLPIVDVHNHVISPDVVTYPHDPMAGHTSAWARERPVDGAALRAAMRRAGVARSVVVQSSTTYGHDNRYLADTVRADRDHFLGVFSVDMVAADAVERIEHWLDAGLSGLRVFIAGHTAADRSIRLDDPRADAAWGAASERRVPICVQIRPDGLPQLDAMLARFPKAVVLLDHFARPELGDGPPYARSAALFALARHANLHFKFTTHNVRESRVAPATQASFSRAVVDAFGAQRIAWGSNFPASPGGLDQMLDEALEATAALTGEQRDWIFSRTAHALYPDLAKMPTTESR